MKRLLSIFMTCLIALSLWTVPVKAADATVTATDPDLVDAFVEEVFDLDFKEEFVDLLLLIRGINDTDDMINAYESAFNGLASGQQDRLESFGVTLEAMDAFADYVMAESFTEGNLLNYLGLDGSSEDPDAFRSAIESREEEFRTAMDAAGADLEKLDLGFSRMDKLFGLLSDARTINDLGISLPFLVATAEYSDLEVNEAVAASLVGIANSQLEDQIDDADPVVSGIQDFVDYYNGTDSTNQTEIYDYLDSYGFIQIEEETNTGGDTTGGGATGGGTNTDNTATLEEIDIPEGGQEEVPLGLPTFTDLDGYQWAVEAINALYGAGVINGVSETELAPGKLVTRAEFAAMLTRLLELTEVADISEFKDVDADSWYYEVLAKAYQAGILRGKGDGLMSPNDNITREEMATMLARTLIASGIEAPTVDEVATLLSVFSDQSNISTWAIEGSAMSTEQGIVQGLTVDDKLHFMPKSSATRAEAIVMLYRLSDIIDTVLTPEATDVVVQ